MRALASGSLVCVTVTLVDGLVLAKSGFNHSMNYRSVVVFGRAEPVPEAGREALLRTYMERLLPGRWDNLRPMQRSELLMTEVVRLPLAEASAKVRTGPPKDEPEDLPWPVWSGVLPMALRVGEPQPDGTSVERPVPGSLARWVPGRR
jgi:nitroimidazol reductase NimA-like FMN-containing flavoprotein (pyridoxamine 5'-phosphate oxidase superfamily)